MSRASRPQADPCCRLHDGMVGRCSSVEGVLFFHKTAHNKVCGLFRLSGSWCLETDIVVEFRGGRHPYSRHLQNLKAPIRTIWMATDDVLLCHLTYWTCNLYAWLFRRCCGLHLSEMHKTYWNKSVCERVFFMTQLHRLLQCWSGQNQL